MWRRFWKLRKPDHISSLSTPANISNIIFRTVWAAAYRKHPLPMHQSVRLFYSQCRNSFSVTGYSYWQICM